MSIFELVMISIGLGMDAFAVSICKGLSLHCPSLHNKLIISCYFGVFQGIMPIIGYFIGYYFSNFISSISHYIVFAILLIIGINMIKESSTSELGTKNNDISNKNLLFLAIANICSFLHWQIYPLAAAKRNKSMENGILHMWLRSKYLD